MRTNYVIKFEQTRVRHPPPLNGLQRGVVVIRNRVKSHEPRRHSQVDADPFVSFY